MPQHIFPFACEILNPDLHKLTDSSSRVAVSSGRKEIIVFLTTYEESNSVSKAYTNCTHYDPEIGTCDMGKKDLLCVLNSGWKELPKLK